MSNRLRITCSILPILATIVACSDSSTNNPPPDECTVSSVGVSGVPVQMTVGTTAQLTANVVSSNCTTAPTVAWSTSSDATATVNASGLVSAVAPGAVTITASVGGKSDDSQINVVGLPVAEVRLSPAVIVLALGRSHQLVAEAFDADGQPIEGVTFTWTSGTPGNVQVDDEGVVTGMVANSNAAIAATADGITGNAAVGVVRSRLAFLWNDDADAAGTRPADADYSYNSLGSANTISHSGPGQYAATFGGQDRLAHETEAIFVSGYGLPGGGYCNQSSWTATSLSITCRNSAGVLANGNWTAAHISSAAFRGRMAYGWIPEGDVTADPSASYRFNSSGGQSVGIRLGEGVYNVSFEGLARSEDSQRESVIVNSYGSNANCQVGDWNLEGFLVPDEMVIQIRCFDAFGTPTNSRFTVLLVEQPREGARLAFALADEPTTPAYSPDNSKVLPTGNVTINRSGVGRYTVHFFGFHRSGDLKESFLISPVGSEPARCHVDQWADSDTPGGVTTVWVECSDVAGVAKDVAFSLLGIQ